MKTHTLGLLNSFGLHCRELAGRELAAHYYAKYREMASQFDALLRRRGEWVRSSMEGPEARQVASVAAALEARRTQITEEIALEAGLLRAELGEVEEKLCAEHVEAEAELRAPPESRSRARPVARSSAR